MIDLFFACQNNCETLHGSCSIRHAEIRHQERNDTHPTPTSCKHWILLTSIGTTTSNKLTLTVGIACRGRVPVSTLQPSLSAQISTSAGRLAQLVHLHVVQPVADIRGSGVYHVERGSSMSLTCAVRQVRRGYDVTRREIGRVRVWEKGTRQFGNKCVARY